MSRGTVADLPRLKRKFDPSIDVLLVNHDWHLRGYDRNCVYCTVGMAMRKKGYDVEALPLRGGTWSDIVFNKAFESKEKKMSYLTTPKSLKKNLLECGDNAYGNLKIEWKEGCEHSLFWINRLGETHIYDCQIGEEITATDSEYKLFVKKIRLNRVAYNRLDNCNPTNYVTSCVKAAIKED